MAVQARGTYPSIWGAFTFLLNGDARIGSKGPSKLQTNKIPFEFCFATGHLAAEMRGVVTGSLKSAASGGRWRPHQDALLLYYAPEKVYTEANEGTKFHVGNGVYARELSFCPS